MGDMGRNGGMYVVSVDIYRKNLEAGHWDILFWMYGICGEFSLTRRLWNL